MIAVFHLSDRCPTAQRADAMMGLGGHQHHNTCSALWIMGLYDCVAVVDSDDLDRAWEYTNNVDGPWRENTGVYSAPGPHRSSSVGDILLTPEGRFMLTANMGFVDITKVIDRLVSAGGNSLREPDQPSVPVELYNLMTDPQILALRATRIPLPEETMQ